MDSLFTLKSRLSMQHQLTIRLRMFMCACMRIEVKIQISASGSGSFGYVERTASNKRTFQPTEPACTAAWRRRPVNITHVKYLKNYFVSSINDQV